MDIAKRDTFIQILEDTLKRNKTFIKEKQKYLNDKKQENTFLDDVSEDYSLYFNGIEQQSEKQKEALLNLTKHISEIMLDSSTPKEMLKYAKHDKKLILNEIKTLD